MAVTEDQTSPYPGEVFVPEKTTPAHTIRATTTPRAVALMVGMLKLRVPVPDEDGKVVPSCEVLEGGGAIWRLTHGLVATLKFDDDGSATWHLDTDALKRDQSSEQATDTSPSTPDSRKAE